jgi:hypothetical protein
LVAPTIPLREKDGKEVSEYIHPCMIVDKETRRIERKVM